MNDDTRPGGLLAWQFQSYSANHSDRRNLALHAIAVPLFHLGSAALLLSPLSLWLGVAGTFAMFGSLAIQGRGHRLETASPAPFRGPLDVVARLLVEQWISFPRFVLSGGFGDAWRRHSATSPPDPQE